MPSCLLSLHTSLLRADAQQAPGAQDDGEETSEDDSSDDDEEEEEDVPPVCVVCGEGDERVDHRGFTCGHLSHRSCMAKWSAAVVASASDPLSVAYKKVLLYRCPACRCAERAPPRPEQRGAWQVPLQTRLQQHSR